MATAFQRGGCHARQKKASKIHTNSLLPRCFLIFKFVASSGAGTPHAKFVVVPMTKPVVGLPCKIQIQKLRAKISIWRVLNSFSDHIPNFFQYDSFSFGIFARGPTIKLLLINFIFLVKDILVFHFKILVLLLVGISVGILQELASLRSNIFFGNLFEFRQTLQLSPPAEMVSVQTEQNGENGDPFFTPYI